MTIKEISSLRKSGKLDEAYTQALSELKSDPTNIWAKRAMSWVIHDYMKLSVEKANAVSFLKHLEEIKALKLPDDEKMIFEHLTWQIGKIVFTLCNTSDENKEIILKIFSSAKELNFVRPSESFSFLFKAFHKALKDKPEYVEFATWWGFENFLRQDFLKEKLQNGKEIMSVAEQAYITFSRHLVENKITDPSTGYPITNKEKIREFLPKLDLIIENQPDYQYPPYYKAKLLFALGEGDNVLSALIPFARKKQSDFWVWDILSDAFKVDDQRKLACLCRAMLCGAKDEFLINVREKLADTLIHNQKYPEAKFQIENIINTRNENGWKIPAKLTNWKNQPWYKEVKNIENSQNFCRKYVSVANEILFDDIPEETVVIEFINQEKKILNFVGKNRKHGFFKYGHLISQVKLGEVLDVRLQEINQEGLYKAFTIKKSNVTEIEGVLKRFSGIVKNSLHKDFGFVDNIFIPPTIYGRYKMTDGDEVSGNAVISFNARKGEWGWKVASIG